MRTTIILSLAVSALALACGGKKQVDYSTTETKPTELVVDEVPVVANLPAWKESSLSLPNAKKWESPNGMFDGPEIGISTTFAMPKNVDEAVTTATLGLNDGPPKRKEKVGEAIVVSTEAASGGSYSVHTFVPASDDKVLTCSVSYVRASGSIDHIAQQRAWAETLCLSVKPKNPPVKVEVTPEMTDFLSQFGTGVSIGKALKKHGAKGLESHDMELYDIKNPEVTKAKKDGTLTCYAISGKAGLTTRSYNVCWEGKQIKRIDDLGMR